MSEVPGSILVGRKLALNDLVEPTGRSATTVNGHSRS
jgi:hypothetical protein